MDYLPLFFDLKKRHALLIGGGDVALRKARLLVRAGAQVRVISHEVHAELRELVELHEGQVLIGEYHPGLLDGVALVIAATDDETLNERVHYDAVERLLPVNVVDNPPLCTFVFPAIVDRSPIVIGISSGGQSPVLARMLRAKLETLIPSGYSRLGQLVGGFRERVKARFSSVNDRRKFWEKILQGEVAERVFAGRDEEAAQLLENELNADQGEPGVGEVYLVGAGPGDPELLTFKALRLMQQADVVLYDRLVSPQVLDLCRRDADLIYVGKARDNHSVPQQGINALLVEHALKGRRVVRLKGGDPFIFGRGGEEIEELKAQGIPFQVVPGITAASACSTYAGIPLTHRDYAQSVKFVTGQLKNRTSDLKFDELVHPNQTIVFYMGLHTLDKLCEGLMEKGKPGDTPVAIVSQGTSAEQRVLTGRLDDIVERQREAQLPAPAIVILGEVVELQSKLAWFGQTEGAQADA
ncbi:siroheme synthase CysG [Marinobacterium lutimaris]|uniref:Siroheme synthase n=1 Tax=Marinobacterium lutimaris TaxID=568106 RepID=A0A1H5YH33_9GAMM|nr:siroheme synthase CysG [Marinobacterium lutimaris]SEG23393.1 uroporphyrinogen-III C-methyltransferase /precorrin-2 dehydrogenase [Marinobacterium lutimaris]